METSPLALVSIARQREDGTYGTLDPVEADSLSEDLRARCLRAIEQYRAEHGTAPNGLVIETTGHIIATYPQRVGGLTTGDRRDSHNRDDTGGSSDRDDSADGDGRAGNKVVSSNGPKTNANTSLR